MKIKIKEKNIAREVDVKDLRITLISPKQSEDSALVEPRINELGIAPRALKKLVAIFSQLDIFWNFFSSTTV